MNKNIRLDAVSRINFILTAHPSIQIGQLIGIAARRGGWSSDSIYRCPDGIIAQGLKLLAAE